MLTSLSPDNLVRLSADVALGEFDCGVSDLNEFLLKDSINYLRQLMAVTYLVKDGDSIVAFFSLSNDNLTSDPGGRSIWNRLCRKIPNGKRRESYPAVKLGRLGVSQRVQCSGLGTLILDWMKFSFITNNKTGCRFIIVDANNNSRTLSFYEKNDFDFLSEADVRERTRQMFFDLKPFQDLSLAGK